jgi:hypothetical protein
MSTANVKPPEKSDLAKRMLEDLADGSVHSESRAVRTEPLVKSIQHAPAVRGETRTEMRAETRSETRAERSDVRRDRDHDRVDRAVSADIRVDRGEVVADRTVPRAAVRADRGDPRLDRQEATVDHADAGADRDEAREDVRADSVEPRLDRAIQRGDVGASEPVRRESRRRASANVQRKVDFEVSTGQGTRHLTLRVPKDLAGDLSLLAMKNKLAENGEPTTINELGIVALRRLLSDAA